MAICPRCQSPMPQAGMCCPSDGWYSVEQEDLKKGDKILGYPIGGKFVALKMVGQGGMGVVYVGRQIGFERVVAIKILSQVQNSSSQVSKRFEREAKSIARIVHQNVVQLIDSGFEDGVAYIIMEYVQGRELSSISPSELSGQIIAHITHQILNALAEAHAQNVIHRDLKPDNIMITEDAGDKYFVKVLDFGLAALTDSSKITISGQALGTPWYMSPEQATASPVTTMTDLYSLGCILYELVSGKPPFSGNRPFNVMMQHVNAEVPALVPRSEIEISREFTAFIFKCLQKDPNMRYRSAIDALDALHRCPEWGAAGQLDPLHSISIVMKQLCELNELRSDVMSCLPMDIEADRSTISSRSNRVSIDELALNANNPVDTNRSGSILRPSAEMLESGDFRTRSVSHSGAYTRPSAESLATREKSDVYARPAAESLTTRDKSGAYTRPAAEMLTTSSRRNGDAISSGINHIVTLEDENRSRSSSIVMNAENLTGEARPATPSVEIAIAAAASKARARRTFHIVVAILIVIVIVIVCALIAILTDLI